MIPVGSPSGQRQDRVTGLFRDALGSRETGPWVEFGFPQALPTSGVTGEVAGEVTGEVRTLLLACRGTLSRKELQQRPTLKTTRVEAPVKTPAETRVEGLGEKVGKRVGDTVGEKVGNTLTVNPRRVQGRYPEHYPEPYTGHYPEGRQRRAFGILK